MTVVWVSCEDTELRLGGADGVQGQSCVNSRCFSSSDRSAQFTRGPILRTEEDREGAVLFNDAESLSVASREHSLAGTLEDSSSSRCSPGTSPGAEGFVDCCLAPMAKPGVANVRHTPTADTASSTDLENDDSSAASSDDEPFSEIGELSDTEIVYCREGVAVWPTKSERITGRLSLINQHCVVFLAWLPYSHGLLNADGSFEAPAEPQQLSNVARDRTMYAVHPVPLSDIKAIRKHAPSFGWQYIIVVLTNGLTLPPLYFSAGGVRGLISALKQHAFLVKSADDPNTYLVNDTADPLRRSLASLELSDVLLGGPPPGASSTFAPASGPAASAWAVEGDASGQLKAPLMSTMLDGVQRMTQLARDTTSSFFAMPPFCEPPAGPGGRGAEPAMSCPQLSAPSLRPGMSGSAALHPGTGLAGRDADPESAEADTGIGVFELVDRAGLEEAATTRLQPRAPPLSSEEWGTFFTADGRIADETSLRRRIFLSGVEPGLRREAWKFLLGFHSFSSTHAQRRKLQAERRTEYGQLKAQWTSITDAQAARFGKWRERRTRVDKDVRRTDRGHPFFSGERNSHLKALRRILLTYCMYNFDLGYCQGMSDLAAPILYIVRDEADAFWCFAALMERLQGNFHTDCNGMHAQLQALEELVRLVDPQLHAFFARKDCLNFFFCYRWLLIHFKREFAFDEVLRLWEAIWSRHLGPHMHIYLAAAVLCIHRRAIMESDLDFDGLLKYCIQLSGRLDLAHLLRFAEKLANAAGKTGREAMARAGLSSK